MSFIRHSECPSCGSSDALAIYSDHEHCFGVDCSYHKNYEEEEAISDPHPVKHSKDRPLTPLPLTPQQGISDRGITNKTVDYFSVSVDTVSSHVISHIYPYFDTEGRHVANKIRKKGEKAFFYEGDPSQGLLFGQTRFPGGGKAITIVEGECDAMAAFQMHGSKYPCVSVKSASEAKKNCADSFEYLDSFDEIVVNFDSDVPGQKAALQVANLFAPGKVRILRLGKGKDACDYLKNDWSKEYINEWWRCPAFMPDGLLLGSDLGLLDDIVNYTEPHCIPYPWQGLNKSTYGLRLSEFTLFTADTGIGKTTFMKEIEYALLKDKELEEKGYGIGFLHLEEPKRDTALGLMSIHRNKPYHLPDTEKSKEELTDAYNETINTKRVVIWDHFGSNDIDSVISKIRHMVALGCRYIVLDHLSILVSDQSGDERKQLDEISTKLKTLTMNLAICIIAVIHINRKGEVRGSAGPEQVSNNVIRLERDKREVNEWRRNVTRMVVEKCRLTGRTGPSCWVYYDPDTGRLVELTPEQVTLFEDGGSTAGNEFAMHGG